MNFEMLEFLTIFIIFVGVVIFMMVFYVIGLQYGKCNIKSHDKEDTGESGPIIVGLLGMLAFLLAFIFSIASSQHELRKQNVLAEANFIGTAYMRSGLLDAKYANEVKQLLREYVDVRLKAAQGGDIDIAIESSLKIHNLLSVQVLSAAKEKPNTNTSLMIQSVNDVTDMHEKRVMGIFHNRIPNSVWIALFIIIALTMITLGIQIDFTNKRIFVSVLTMLLSFAVLVTLVVAIDRPSISGLIPVEQQAMIDLQNAIKPVEK